MEIGFAEFLWCEIGKMIGSKDRVAGQAALAVPRILGGGRGLVVRPDSEPTGVFGLGIILFVVAVEPSVEFVAECDQ